jgi:hypothetical protein
MGEVREQNRLADFRISEAYPAWVARFGICYATDRST